MPREKVYHSRRQRGLCVCCPERVKTARCPKCKAKERARERATKHRD